MYNVWYRRRGKEEEWHLFVGGLSLGDAEKVRDALVGELEYLGIKAIAEVR
jgi:hypothetical protein